MESPFKYLVIDGQIVPYADAKIHIHTPAVRYGATAFEGIRAYWNEAQDQLYVFRCREHLERLLQSAELMGMQDVDYSVDDIQATLIDLLRANEVRQEVHIRPSLFVAGNGPIPARSPISLGLLMAPAGLVIHGELAVERPFRVAVSSWRRIDDNTLSPRIKCAANYQNARMALIQAEEDGYDGALMLDSNGHVTEEPRACFFMVRNGVPITPAVSNDILESVTRETVIQLLRDQHGLHVSERPVDRTEVYVADEVFLCGTGLGITPVGEVDRFTIGEGAPGPMTAAVSTSYADLVNGATDLHPEWRTPVYN